MPIVGPVWQPSSKATNRLAPVLRAWLDHERRVNFATIDPEVVAEIEAAEEIARAYRSQPPTGSDVGTVGSSSETPFDMMGWMTVTDASKKYGISGSRIRKLARDGRLAARLTSAGWLVDPSNLVEHIKNRSPK
jgi:hypothetical protein